MKIYIFFEMCGKLFYFQFRGVYCDSFAEYFFISYIIYDECRKYIFRKHTNQRPVFCQKVAPYRGDNNIRLCINIVIRLCGVDEI